MWLLLSCVLLWTSLFVRSRHCCVFPLYPRDSLNFYQQIEGVMRLSLSSFKGWVHIFLSLTHTYYLFLLSILACIKIPSQSYSGLSMQCCGIIILGFRSHMAKSHIKITFRRLKCNSRAISIKIIL